MEMIFDGASYQATDVTVKDVEKAISNKKWKFNEGVNILSKASIESFNDEYQEEKSIDSKEYAKLKESQKVFQIGHKIPIGVRLFS